MTLCIGAALTLFILFFLVLPSGSGSAVSQRISNAASQHHLSPPTSPYKKSASKKDFSPPPVVRYNLNKVTVTSNPLEHKEEILILSPMSRFFNEYWENLLKLDYPHGLITLGFILPKTKEGNEATALLQKAIHKTQKYGAESKRFKSIVILRQDFEPAVDSQAEADRHKMAIQKARRAVMSKARNSLLFTTLGPSTSWVLWLDADVVETPLSIIQDMAAFDKDVLAANCYQRYLNPETNMMGIRPYDFNNWQDSEAAQDMASRMGPDDILLEGYAEMATWRTLMGHMYDANAPKNTIVPLDGVGGTALMVKAEVHRDGAMFPPFAFYNLIETEGFARMAKRLNRQPYGLPNYLVSIQAPT